MINKHGEKILGDAPSVERAQLRNGPRDGEMLEGVGCGLPSDIRYPVNGNNAVHEHRYTLRGTSATGLWYEYTGQIDVR